MSAIRSLTNPQHAPSVKDFIEESVRFPNGAHDDQVDAMVQALLRWHAVPKQQTYVSYCDIGQISPI